MRVLANVKQRGKRGHMANDAKQILLEYERARARAERARVKYETLRDSLADVTAIDYGHTKVQHSGNNSPVERITIKAETGREKYIKALAEQADALADATALIDKLENPVQADVLFYRYIKNMIWEDVAHAVGYECGYVRGTLHSRALKELNRILEND